MSTKPFVFTLMPFSEGFDDIYKLGIKETAESVGAYCERVDEQIFEGTILDRIINQISKADIIVADMTGKNPNVFFEVGYAKALDKKIILLTKTTSDIPFDLKHYPHIVYEGRIVELKRELNKSLVHYLEKPNAGAKEFQLEVDILVNGVALIPGEETIVPVGSECKVVLLSIRNRTNRVIRGGNIQIGLVGENIYGVLPESETKWVKISENKAMNLYTHNEDIFPRGWGSIELFYVKLNFEYSAALKVFTENGCFEFMFKEVKES